MSVEIEAKIKEYIAALEEGLNDHIFDPTWSSAGSLVDKKKIMQDSLQVTGINGTSLVFLNEYSTQDYSTQKIILKMNYEFRVNYLNRNWDSSTISVPYTNLNWNNLLVNLQRAYVDMWVYIERNYLLGHTDDLLDAKINFYNFVKKEWDDIIAKLKAVQNKIVLNAFVLQKGGLDDRQEVIKEAKKKIGDIEYQLDRLFKNEIADPYEKVYRPKKNNKYNIPKINIFGDSQGKDYFEYKNDDYVLYWGINRSSQYTYRFPVDKKTGGHVNTWSLIRYLPFSKYWSLLKDTIEKVEAQKEQAKGNNGNTNP